MTEQGNKPEFLNLGQFAKTRIELTKVKSVNRSGDPEQRLLLQYSTLKLTDDKDSAGRDQYVKVRSNIPIDVEQYDAFVKWLQDLKSKAIGN